MSSRLVASPSTAASAGEARLAYARFLVGHGLGFEAVGVLNALIKQTPAMQGVAEQLRERQSGEPG